jgi:hypothetical protein
LQFSPPNYQSFSGWSPELLRLGLWPPKLPTPLKMATSLGLPVILDGKMTTCRAHDCEDRKNPKLSFSSGLKPIWFFSRGLTCHPRSSPRIVVSYRISTRRSRATESSSASCSSSSSPVTTTSYLSSIPATRSFSRALRTSSQPKAKPLSETPVIKPLLTSWLVHSMGPLPAGPSAHSRPPCGSLGAPHPRLLSPFISSKPITKGSGWFFVSDNCRTYD